MQGSALSTLPCNKYHLPPLTLSNTPSHPNPKAPSFSESPLTSLLVKAEQSCLPPVLSQIPFTATRRALSSPDLVCRLISGLSTSFKRQFTLCFGQCWLNPGLVSICVIFCVISSALMILDSRNAHTAPLSLPGIAVTYQLKQSIKNSCHTSKNLVKSDLFTF